MDAKTDAIENGRRMYDDVREAVEPLLHDFLTHPSDGEQNHLNNLNTPSTSCIISPSILYH